MEGSKLSSWAGFLTIHLELNQHLGPHKLWPMCDHTTLVCTSGPPPHTMFDLFQHKGYMDRCIWPFGWGSIKEVRLCFKRAAQTNMAILHWTLSLSSLVRSASTLHCSHYLLWTTPIYAPPSCWVECTQN